MLTVVCWKWEPNNDSKLPRFDYTSEHVNILRAMVARHYRDPHRFVCVTDDPTGLEPDIITVPLWPEWHNVKSPYSPDQPACYVRLKAFHPETAAEYFGDRFVSIDLDCIIVDDLRPLWNRDEPFVIWFHRLPGRQANGPKTRFQGSMWMLNRGVYPEVWTRFQGTPSAAEALSAGYHGSDQGWMHYIIGDKGAGYWSERDGIYSYSYGVRGTKILPKGTRIVFFHGQAKPWDKPERDKYRWVRESYPMDVEP